MKRAVRLRGHPALLALALGLALVGCPDPPPPTPGPPSPPPSSRALASPPPALAPWVLIPPSRVEALPWPLLTDVAEWPDPAGLTPLAAAPPERRPPAVRGEALVALTRSLLRPGLVPARPDLGLDAQQRLHLPLDPGTLRGSASADAHAGGPPTLTVAFQTGERAAASIAELRQQVANVLNDDLRAELSRDDHALYPADGVPAAGLAQLDTEAGYGVQFPYLYAYSGRGTLVLVFQEARHAQERE